MRVLVCGGRDYDDKRHVWDTLDRIAEVSAEQPLGKRPFVIVHGACRSGVDELADAWAVSNYILIDEFPADWTSHGRAAGPIRNQRMIDDGRPDLVIAFPGGRGTADMVSRAERAGIKVVRA
jgi:hypothetical protein